MEDYSVEDPEDLCAESITKKKALLQKWQRKHKRCSCALLVLAIIFMACSSFHLLFPPRFDKMMDKMNQHGHRGPHEQQTPAKHHDNGKHGGHGGRHLRHGGDKKHDEELFVVKNNFKDDHKFDESQWFPKMNFKDEKKHDGKGHHNGQKDFGGEYQVDKKVLQERRISKMMTRASFVSFLMWLFIAISAAIGIRASKMTSDSRWYMRCSFRKSIIFLVLATVLGIWKMTLNKKLMKQFERFEKEMEEPVGNFGKKHHGGKKNNKKQGKFGGSDGTHQWSFNEVKQMSKVEQNQMIEEMFN